MAFTASFRNGVYEAIANGNETRLEDKGVNTTKTSDTGLHIDPQLSISVEPDEQWFFEVTCFFTSQTSQRIKATFGGNIDPAGMAWTAPPWPFDTLPNETIGEVFTMPVIAGGISKFTIAAIRTFADFGAYGLSWAQHVSSSSGLTVLRRSNIFAVRMS